MDQFVTTYRKDYLWPYVKTFGIRPAPESLYQPQLRDQQQLCPCHCLKDPHSTGDQAKLFGPPANNEDAWSRLGPMGPLLDPKMYPAKVSATPESDVSRYNQPNVFLQKLQEKYPFIYECLRTAPPDDLISRINRDRLRSTYQVDFCKMKEKHNGDHEHYMKTAARENVPACKKQGRRAGPVCRPNQRPIAFRPGVISNSVGNASMMGASGIGNVKKSGVRGITAWNPFDKNAPKCDEIIEKWGQMVYRDSSHSHGPLTPARKRLR